MSEEKYSYYAVRVGKVPGIYTSWLDCEEQVHKHKFCQFKGFNEFGEAVAYMRKGPKGGRSWRDDVKGGSPSGSLSGRLKTLVMESVGGSSSSAADQGSTQGHTETYDSNTSEGEEYVDVTQEGGVLITEDMEVCLMRACTKLQVGCPVFEIRERYSYGGHHTVAYKVDLRCSTKDVELEVHGSFFPEEKEARQDACFRILEKLLVCTGKKIVDYSYRAMMAARREINELRSQLATPLIQRLQEVERERDQLKEELDKFLQW
ncbi:hypothetical protein PIB30_092118 [Stylosanthes scabra]|uniref:Ribonuclease H1 N-terminal domain-containing protein n=1 Tax=Stylosanthes scabra TaxID=79078 RepID=A0ABU6TVG3_9FABA|nr:hypothetical protein [Stylosanthes scabra]